MSRYHHNPVTGRCHNCGQHQKHHYANQLCPPTEQRPK